MQRDTLGQLLQFKDAFDKFVEEFNSMPEEDFLRLVAEVDPQFYFDVTGKWPENYQELAEAC